MHIRSNGRDVMGSIPATKRVIEDELATRSQLVALNWCLHGMLIIS